MTRNMKGLTFLFILLMIPYSSCDRFGPKKDYEKIEKYWAFPKGDGPVTLEDGFAYYNLNDGFFGHRVLQENNTWFAKIIIPENYQNNLHDAVKKAVLKSFNVDSERKDEYLDYKTCLLEMKLLEPSVAKDCPIAKDISSDVMVLTKSSDGKFVLGILPYVKP